MSPMMEFYPQIKWTHVHAVMCSGALFALRGGTALFGMRWPRHAVVRYTSYTIDTVLLTGAMMLLTILPAGGFIVFGLLLAVFNTISMRQGKKKEAKSE